MEWWKNLKDAIKNVIKPNNNKEITGAVLQNALISIINSMSERATYAGVATPTTSPGSYDGPVYYMAATPGVYPNFSGVELVTNEVAVLMNKAEGTWEKQTLYELDLGYASEDEITKLNARISNITGATGNTWTPPRDAIYVNKADNISEAIHALDSALCLASLVDTILPRANNQVVYDGSETYFLKSASTFLEADKILDAEIKKTQDAANKFILPFVRICANVNSSVADLPDDSVVYVTSIKKFRYVYNGIIVGASVAKYNTNNDSSIMPNTLFLNKEDGKLYCADANYELMPYVPFSYEQRNQDNNDIAVVKSLTPKPYTFIDNEVVCPKVYLEFNLVESENFNESEITPSDWADTRILAALLINKIPGASAEVDLELTLVGGTDEIYFHEHVVFRRTYNGVVAKIGIPYKGDIYNYELHCEDYEDNEIFVTNYLQFSDTSYTSVGFPQSATFDENSISASVISIVGPQALTYLDTDNVCPRMHLEFSYDSDNIEEASFSAQDTFEIYVPQLLLKGKSLDTGAEVDLHLNLWQDIEGNTPLEFKKRVIFRKTKDGGIIANFSINVNNGDELYLQLYTYEEDDGSISVYLETDYIEYAPLPKRLWDTADAKFYLKGLMINGNNGELIKNNNYETTGILPLNKMCRLTVSAEVSSSADYYLFFYDIQGRMIGRYNKNIYFVNNSRYIASANIPVGSTIIPSNAVYFGVNARRTTDNSHNTYENGTSFEEREWGIPNAILKSKESLFRDLWRQAGFYNSNRFYTDIDYDRNDGLIYKCNGLGLTYEEALNVYSDFAANTTGEGYEGSYIRTNIPGLQTGSWMPLNLHARFAYCTYIEVIRISKKSDTIYVSTLFDTFSGCVMLKTIHDVITFNGKPSDLSATVTMNAFKGCAKLMNVKIANLGKGISFKDSPILSHGSLKYIVDNAYKGSSFTITVHPTIYGYLTDENNSLWYSLFTAAAAKNITFASA